MDRRSFLAGAPASALAAQTAHLAQTPAAPAKPNIIWLFADQHRAQALGCNGDPNARTPNLDNMSELGVNFTTALSGFPLCCPFRGSLLSGRYPHHCVPGHEYPLPDGQQTVAKPFKDAGYHTGYFGKWHLGGHKERNGRGGFFITDPDKRGGFDTWVGYENNNSQWDCWVHGGAGRDAFHYRLPGYETDELTNLLIKYIRERAQDQKPYFAVISVQPPHDPYVAPADFMGRYAPARIEMRPNVPNVPRVMEQARREIAGYYAMIENWDWNIGRIRRALEETGQSFHTHLVAFSDHGDMHGSQGMFRKTNPFEESIRVPFLMAGEQPRYNGRVNGRFPVPLNHVDIAPTSLGLCGIPKPDWMEGTDYSHHRFGRKSEREEPDSAYLQNVVPTGHAHSINKPYRGLVTRDGWKYVAFEQTSFVLFNLNEDPFEQVNLAHNNRYRAERQKLIRRLKEWVAGTGDKFALPED
ncbi:MAG: sulfatase [Bryobacteraceae bacterium]|nr:sulfatase [Bryobacteraceae bacterium]